MRKLFTGVATALVTPFNDGQVDYDALRALITRQIEMNVRAIVLLGTTGEISTLSVEEKHKIIETAIDFVSTAHIALIFGIGGNNPAEVIELGKFVKACAVRANHDKIGVMITAPYYNKGTQDGIYRFFEAITNAVKLPAVAYNIPGRTGVNIEPETLYRISTLKYVVGIKEASGNIAQITEVVRICPNVAVYCGDDTLALPSYAVGCQGIISVASNISAVPVAAIYNMYKHGKTAAALSAFHGQLPFYKSLFTSVNPIPVKNELTKIGLIKNELRLPLTPIIS